MGSGPSLPVELPDDAAVLVAGPPMTGKYDLLLRALASRGAGAVFITTTRDPATLVEDYCSASGVAPERVGVVACTGGDAGDADRVRGASLDNLTGVGVEFTELFERFSEENAGPVGVGIHSLSPLLMHADIPAVYRFLSVIIGQIRTVGWPGGAVINDEAADAESLRTLKGHFDGVLQTRQAAGERELRLKGIDPEPSAWRSF